MINSQSSVIVSVFEFSEQPEEPLKNPNVG